MRVRFNRDSHSDETTVCRDRPRVCQQPDDRTKYVIRSVDRIGIRCLALCDEKTKMISGRRHSVMKKQK